jgi:outer membrane protein
MKKKLLSVMAALACGISTHANAEDLLQVYQIALANDPVTLKAQANRDAQKYSSDVVMARLLPQIGASMGYQNGESDLAGDIDRFSRGLSLTQDLFNLSSWKSLNVAEKQSLQAEANYDLAQQNLIIRVASAYFNVLARQDDLEFVRSEKRAIERQLEQTKQRHAVGLTAITDVHEAQAQFDNAVAREIIAVNEVEIAREELGEITGKYHKKLNVLDTDKFSTIKPSRKSTEFVESAKENNISLQISRVAVDIAKEQIDQAKSGHYPTLSLSASYGDQLGKIGPRVDESSVGLQFSLPIYQGGATQASVEQASKLFVATSQDFESAYRSVNKQVRTSYNQVVSDIATYKALEQAVVSANSALQATEAGFEVGTRTIVDVLLSTRNLFDASRNLSAVRYRYVLSVLALKQAEGSLTGEDLEAINQGLTE